MAGELENPMEALDEHIHEAAHAARERWLKWAALLTSFLAVFAAATGLISAHRESDAMIEQIEASDQWNYYQAKGIKEQILTSQRETLTQMDRKLPDGIDEHIQHYKDEQKEIEAKALESTAQSKMHLAQHEVLSRSATLFQIAIAMTAIAMLTHKKNFLIVSFGFGGIALLFMLQGLFL